MKLKARTKALRDARKKLGYTQRDVAELLSAFFETEISEHSYNKWETGARTIDLRTSKAVASIVELPIHKVFKSADKRIKFGAEL